MSITPETAPEVPAWVKDSAGMYYRIGGGGAVAPVEPEVLAQATPPAAGTSDLFWADTSAPQASVTVEPYVKVSGDTMGGPLVLSGAPTLLTQAGRWADGTPRFADAAARDAAYATIGGPVEGMQCSVGPRKQWYDGTSWQQDPRPVAAYAQNNYIGPLASGWNTLPLITLLYDYSTPGEPAWALSGGGLAVPEDGLYEIAVWLKGTGAYGNQVIGAYAHNGVNAWIDHRWGYGPQLDPHMNGKWVVPAAAGDVLTAVIFAESAGGDCQPAIYMKRVSEA